MNTVQYDNLEFEVKKYKVGDSKIKYYVDEGETFYKLQDILKHLSKEVDKQLNVNQLSNKISNGQIKKAVDSETRGKQKSSWINKEGLLEAFNYLVIIYPDEITNLLDSLEISHQFKHKELISFEGYAEEESVLLREINGKLFSNSIDIAKYFGKKHKHVKAFIKKQVVELNKLEQSFNRKLEDCIQIKTYLDSTGRIQEYYLLNSTAFNLIINSFQGYQEYKWAFVLKFEEMEKELKSLKNKTLQTNEIQSVNGDEDNEFLKNFMTYRVTDIAKELGLTSYELNTILVILGVQYKSGISDSGARYYLSEGYDRNLVRDSFYSNEYGERHSFMTWTSEGKKMIMKLVEDYMMDTNHEEEEAEFETEFI